MTRPLRRLLSAAALAAAAIVPHQASALTTNICSFPAPLSSWTLNQNAFSAQNDIRLTDADPNEWSSAFLDTPVTLAANTPFHAHFTFAMSAAPGGGDGLAFVLQNVAAGAAALGPTVIAGGLGYNGIGAKSVIVEFDTYLNAANGDPNANHVGLMLTGLASAHAATATPSFTMAGAGVLHAWIDYDGNGNLGVSIGKTSTKPATPLLTHAVNLFTALGAQMYVGFAASTGASPEENQHDVYELEMSTVGQPCSCEGDTACVGIAGTPACGASGVCAVCSATNTTACTGATPVCDVPVNTCVGCLTSANCAAPTPICDATALKCRACSTNTDCSGNTPYCDTTAGSASLGSCVSCVTDANCSQATPRCNPTTNTCAQCLTTADCGGDTPVCSANDTCRGCASDADCSGTTPACQVTGACGQCSSTNATQCKGGTDVCDFPTGTCVDCEFNSDCSGTTPTCNTTTHVCGPCQTNADCVGNPGGPACVTSGTKQGSCVICQQDSDCTSPAAPKCDTVANLCVACLTNTDCAAPTPVCNSANICVGCLSNGDCSSATPVCDAASSTCVACQNDYLPVNPGPEACPTATLPACQPTGTGLAGQCAICSATNQTLCAGTATTPVCITSTATCGCTADNDCNADTYCDTTTTSTGVCKAGCRVVNGGTNCATGEYCTQTNGSVGTCMAEPCNSNADCKTTGVGVCDTILQPHACVQCLNDPDCKTAGLNVCDSMNHCVQCTPGATGQAQACTAEGSGAVCLASETCGCMVDTDCGAANSGRVCNMTTNTCTAGCRGTGTSGCPNGQMCSSTTGTIGTCEAASTSTSSTTSSASTSASSSSGGTGGAPGSFVLSASRGCSCRAAGSDDGDGDHPGRLVGVAIVTGLGIVLRRRSRGSRSLA